MIAERTPEEILALANKLAGTHDEVDDDTSLELIDVLDKCSDCGVWFNVFMLADDHLCDDCRNPESLFSGLEAKP